MKTLLLATLMLTLVGLAFCIPATARNGRSTQLPSRNRGGKISGESDKAVAKSVLQNPGREPVGDVSEFESNSTNPNVVESLKRSRRIEEKSRPRGKKRIEGTTTPATIAAITMTTAAMPQAAELSKTSESDFVFENDKTFQQENEEKSVDVATKPPVIENLENTTTESAVTTTKVDVIERTSKTEPATSKKQDSGESVLKPSRACGCYRRWPSHDDYHQIPPEYSVPQIGVPQYEPPITSWNFNGPYDFYPSPPSVERPPWNPFQEQPYETPYYPPWPEEEQFYEMEPYWGNNRMHTNEGRCHSKKSVTTPSTTTPSPIVTETTTATTTTTTPVQPTTAAAAAATKPAITTPIPKSSSTWLGIENLLEAYKSDLMNDADASSRKQLSKMFHEIIQNYEPLVNSTVDKKME
ncbi:hypothetical protein TcWFU_007175 [Taenia crassiceps]|uniref:Uncharacterized protein n=1 Tax=Taenia crassiceps TaxID=6207 RepID=A0ABR4Q2F1_9CEST